MTGRALTRKQRQAHTRECLLRSAARVFSKRGLHNASLDDVARDAGFTKGAVYANFANKEDLFLAMLDERFADRLREVERVVERVGETVEERAREAGDDFVAHLQADPEWQRLFFEFASHATREPAFRRALIERYRVLRERIAELYAGRGEDIGPAPFVTPEQAALMTFAMANGFALERLLEPDAIDDELFGTMLVIFFAGLRALSGSAAAPLPSARD